MFEFSKRFVLKTPFYLLKARMDLIPEGKFDCLFVFYDFNTTAETVGSFLLIVDNSKKYVEIYHMTSRLGVK